MQVEGDARGPGRRRRGATRWPGCRDHRDPSGLLAGKGRRLNATTMWYFSVMRWSEQRRMIRRAFAAAGERKMHHVLSGTIGDTRAFCWATLRQFERRD